MLILIMGNKFRIRNILNGIAYSKNFKLLKTYLRLTQSPYIDDIIVVTASYVNIKMVGKKI